MNDMIYDKNMDILRSRYPQVADYVEHVADLQEENVAETGIAADVCDIDGKLVLAVERGDITYRLDSLYESKPILNLWFKSLGDNWDYNSKLFLYGLGNGMYVRTFLQSVRNDCSIIAYEPSARIFSTVIKHFDLTDILSSERVSFIFGPVLEEPDIKCAIEDHMTYADAISCRSSIHLNYATLFPDDCVRFHDNLIRVRDAVTASQTVHDRFGADYNKNTFNNLRLLRESMDIVKLIESVPEGIPAIVVAAGPSLDKNIREIAKAKGKCIIISTDTALKPLSLAGIIPDIAMIMDGKKDARYLSEEDSRSVPLVCTPRSGTEFLHLHKGIKFFTNDYCEHINGFMETCDRRLIDIETGGSVANSCFSLALLFKCKTIILMGQDLAYTGDKTHSSVTVRGSVKTEVENLEHVVMDVDIEGKPVRSSEEFKTYREWFERKIAGNSELNVIDATEGGVRIAGTTLMTARDAIEKYCTESFDFSEVVADAAPLLDDNMKCRYDAFIKAIPGQLSEIRKLIRSTIADYSTMRRMVESGDYHNSRMRKLYDNCQKNTNRIEENPVTEYVHYQMQGKSSELLSVVNKLEEDERQELLTVCDIGEKYLQDMDNAVSELEPYVEIIERDFQDSGLNVEGIGDKGR